jgi:hypothetical protein
MRMYEELAVWWPLLSPPPHYADEAAHLLPLLEPDPRARLTLLELGSGGGSLAWHFRNDFDLTLTDLSADMLVQSRRVNTGTEHRQGDMRTLRLERRFDRVFIHDAIMFMTTADDVLAALTTARVHCLPNAKVLVVPDSVAETYETGSHLGGEDAPDGRGMRFVEWHWDPDPSDTHYEVAYAFLLRDASGAVTVESDRQRCGIFSRATWFELFARAGFTATSVMDPWQRDVFVAHPKSDA